MEKDISNTTQELKNMNDELKEAQENIEKINKTPVEVQVKGEEDIAGLKDVLKDLLDQSGDAAEAFADFGGCAGSGRRSRGTVRSREMELSAGHAQGWHHSALLRLQALWGSDNGKDAGRPAGDPGYGRRVPAG